MARSPLWLFLGLVGLESVLWRSAGWLGCRNIVASGVDIRADLFEHLLGHPMRYFSRHLSGALGSSITATAGATGSILSSSRGTFCRRASILSARWSCS